MTASPPGWGPSSTSPLDQLATGAIQGATRHLWTNPVRPALTTEEKREAGDLVRQGHTCQFCAGLHVGASGPACPRLAAGKLNGDGTVVEFSYWPDGQWDASRIVFVADVAENVEADVKEAE